MDSLDKMMQDCALVFSTKGDMTVSQRHVFLGIIFDTVKGRIFVTKEKFDKLLELIREIADLQTCSPRNMARLRGKAQHQLRCIEGVRPYLVRFNNFIGGPESVYEWDHEKSIDDALRRTMWFLYRELPPLMKAGAETWPMAPATVYHRWSRGAEHPYGDLIVGTWDASNLGVAQAVADEPGKVIRLAGMKFDGVSTIVTFGDTPEAQVHREAAGAPMIMRLMRSMFNLKGRTVLLRNDCLPVIYALQKGSPSPQLQAAAEAVCQEALEAGCRVLCLHVPGVQLIAEGVDGGSREGAALLQGPACSAALRATVAGLLSQHGWTLTLDLFAADSNKMTARYVSWTDEPSSEAVDAFSMSSWSESLCTCGQYHRETLFIFPPRGMKRAAVCRARSDRVRACFLVPTSHKLGYWKLLRSNSTALMAVNNPTEAFTHVLAPLAAHILFLVDFGSNDDTSPGCGREMSLRGRQSRWSGSELQTMRDLQHIAQSLN
jgi:hypothetical protein